MLESSKFYSLRKYVFVLSIHQVLLSIDHEIVLTLFVMCLY